MTAVQPYSGVPPSPVTALRISGGTRVERAMPGEVTATVLFVDVGRSTASEGDRAAVTGEAGVVLWSGRSVLAAQLLEGQRLAWKKADVVRSSSSATVGVTWGPAGPWGTVEAQRYPVEVWVKLQAQTPTRVEITAGDGSVVWTAPAVVGGGVAFPVAGPSTFRVWTSTVRPAGPEAACFGSDPTWP